MSHHFHRLWDMTTDRSRRAFTCRPCFPCYPLETRNSPKCLTAMVGTKFEWNLFQRFVRLLA